MSEKEFRLVAQCWSRDCLEFKQKRSWKKKTWPHLEGKIATIEQLQLQLLRYENTSPIVIPAVHFFIYANQRSCCHLAEKKSDMITFSYIPLFRVSKIIVTVNQYSCLASWSSTITVCWNAVRAVRQLQRNVPKTVPKIVYQRKRKRLRRRDIKNNKVG